MNNSEYDRLLRYMKSMPFEINNQKFLEEPIIQLFYNQKVQEMKIDSKLYRIISEWTNTLNYTVEIVNRNRNSRQYYITVPFGKIMAVYYNDCLEDSKSYEPVIYEEGFYVLRQHNVNSNLNFHIAHNDIRQNIFCIWYGNKNELANFKLL